MSIDFARFAWLGMPLVVTGLVVVLVVAGGIFVSELRRSRTQTRGDASVPRVGRRLDRAWLVALVVVLAVGALVRLTGLEVKGISHPEAYIPGLDLPASISEPPPRHGLVETAVWHFRSEPHPVGYYLAMWLWTQIFGASLLSIRAPEAILGTLSVYLVYRVGRSAYNARVGVIAAALLALHGFHIFWSQAARSYAPGACLGLLSTGLLLETTRGARPRPGLEAAYVLTTVAGTMTVEFFWPFLAAQMLWIALRHGDRRRRPPRAAVVQTFAFVCAAPMLSHAAMLGYNTGPPPSLAFLIEYFSFGFLFQHGAFERTVFELPLAASVTILLLSLVLIGSGLRFGSVEDPPVAVRKPPSPWPLVVAALGSFATMLGIALVSYLRNGWLAVLSLLPLVMLLAPWATGALRPTIARFSPRLERVLARGGTTTALIALLAIVPTLTLFLASYTLTLMAPRAYMLFVPYLVLLAASGAWLAGGRRPLVAAALVVVLGPMFVGSAVVLRRTPTSTRDYQGLARALTSSLEPGDRIFVHERYWAVTPIFFYLDHRQLIATAYNEALHMWPRPRVWVIAIPPGNPPSADVTRALSEYRIADRIEAEGIGAVLYRHAP